VINFIGDVKIAHLVFYNNNSFTHSISDQLTNWSMQHFCAHPKPRPGFPTSYVVVFFVLCELR